MSYKLWIDDQWDEPEMFFRHPPKDYIPASSSLEAIEIINKFGFLPKEISFDHDLGENDTSIIFINYIIENYYNYEIPEYKVHSANPVGKANIISKMESWRKSKEID